MTARVIATAKPDWSVCPSAIEGCYDVVAPNGAIYGTYATASAAKGVCANRKVDAIKLASSHHVTRPCICCRTPFQSEGKHHRMCGSCRLRGTDGLVEQRPFIRRGVSL